MGIGLI